MHARLVKAYFQRCESDMCLYWKKDGEDLVVVGVYVDDLLATGTNAAAVDRLFDSLTSLSIKDLGLVSKILGAKDDALLIRRRQSVTFFVGTD